MTPHQPPGGGPPNFGRPSQMQLLQERVQQKYGAFGSAPEPDAMTDDKRVLSDNFFKQSVKIIGLVLMVSLLGFVVSHPTFDAPAVWSNTFRIDTALIVLWGPALFWAMGRVKLQRSLRTYLVLCLFIEAFTEAMFREGGAEGGYWDTILWPASVGFFGTLKEFAGVPGGSLPIFTVVTVALLVRAVSGKKAIDYVAPPKFARNALYTFLGCIVVLAAMGIARSGQIEWTFRQTIHLLHWPVVGLLFLYALRVPDDLAAVGTIFVTAAVVRSLLVLYVYFGVCVAGGIVGTYRHSVAQPEWCTNHSDTVLFVTALMILLAYALEQRNKRVTWRCIGLGLLILFAVGLNNRRLAFVSMAVAPLAIYLALKPSKRKRKVTAAIGILVPLLMGYVLIGSEIDSPSPFLKPAKAVVSVMDQKDTSAQSRDIENENLIYTLRESNYGLLTTGFGHEYLNSPNNPPVDLTGFFANFKLIAHNGVLWLWSIAGVFGFTILWSIYPLAGTMAVRGYRGAQTPLERSAALASLGAVVVCVIQIWGDQGFSSYMTLLTFGVANAVAARLAMKAG